MSYWDLTSEEIDIHKPVIESFLCSGETNINLTNSGLNISKLKHLLEFLGYEETDFSNNGFQYDFWMYFSGNSDLSDVVIYGTGYTFELYLGFKDC